MITVDAIQLELVEGVLLTSMSLNWKDLPVEIQEKMLDEQEAQGNKRNAEVFKYTICNTFHSGGFNWGSSTQGFLFWETVLDDGDYLGTDSNEFLK